MSPRYYDCSIDFTGGWGGTALNEQRIAVITDTGTDTPAEFVREHDVRIVPLRIIFSDGATYESGVTITPEELVARLPQEIPTTSLPSPEVIRDTFEQARADGYTSAIFVSISSGLSATCHTVRMVADALEDFPVTVVDTLNIGIAAGTVVIEAVNMIELGVPYGMLGPALEAVARKTSVWFSVKTLTYLRKGGRISEAVYRVGKVLNIKPIITCDDKGYYVMARKARGWEKSLDTEVMLAAQKARTYPKVRLAICCSATCEMFHELEAKLRAQIDNVADVVYSGVSADLLVHTGPDLVGICVQGL